MSTARYLLVRGEDLVVLGLDLTGFGPSTDPTASPGTLLAGAGATIGLTFPPQAIVEQKVDAFPADVASQARLAGTSRVVFDVPAGTSMPLTVEGVLTVAGAAPVAPGVLGAGSGTAVELPWKLIVAPVDRGGGAVTTGHPIAPVSRPVPSPDASPDPSMGHALWATRLQSTNGLAIQPLRALDDSTMPNQTPLDASQREVIVLRTEQPGSVLPEVDRLELSALGGSLTAQADWGDARWEHDMALGRDGRVSFVQIGAMFPTGHRAQLLTSAERRVSLDALDQPSALFATESVLTILQPVRRFASDGSQAARMLPFDELEITTTSYAGLVVPDVWDDQWRPGDSMTAPLIAALQSLTDERDSLAGPVAQQLAAAQAATPAVSPEVQQATDARDAAAQALAAAQDALREWDAEAGPLDQEAARLSQQYSDALSQGATDDELDQIRQLIDDNAAARLRLGGPPNVNQATADLNTAQAALNQAIAWYPPPSPPHDASELDSDEARRYVDLRDHLVPDAQRALDAVSVPVNRSFQPRDATGPIAFPVRGGNPAGDVHFLMPMRFVADNDLPSPAHLIAEDAGDWGSTTLNDPGLGAVLAGLPSGQGTASLAGAALDVVRSAVPVPGDIHEVHAIALALADGGLSAAPVLKAMQIKLPSVRTLLPSSDDLLNVAYHSDFVQQGEQAVAVLQMLPDAVPGFDQPGLSKLVVDFTQDADRAGGVATPKFALDAISRINGPVNLGALPGALGVPDFASIFKDAKLLGIDLLSLLPNLPLAPPLITQAIDAAEHPPTVTMDWESVKLKSFGPFLSNDAVLSLHAKVGIDGAEITGTLTDFALELPPGTPLVHLGVAKLEFTRKPGKAPHLSLSTPTVTFLGDLKLLAALAEKVALGSAAELISLTPTGISAGYSLHMPDVPVAAFSLSNIDIHAGVDLPFTGGLVTMSLGFASRDKPFDLTVLMFGGGGYIDIVLDANGLQRFEASLDFGAHISINLGIASAEVHALGGVRFLKAGPTFGCSGFLRIGGSVDILGLISLSVELLVELTYTSATNELSGRATLVIEVDLTFWSDSIELDSGPWVLAGGGSLRATDRSSSSSIGAGSIGAGSIGAGAGAIGVPGAAADADVWTRYWNGFGHE